MFSFLWASTSTPTHSNSTGISNIITIYWNIQFVKERLRSIISKHSPYLQMLAFLLLSPLTTEGLLVFLELEFYPSWNLESENYFISNLHIKLQRTEDTFYKTSYHTDSLYSFQSVTKPKFMLPSHSLEAWKITIFKSGVIRVSTADVSCFWAGASTALWIEMKQKIAKIFSDLEFTPHL